MARIFRQSRSFLLALASLCLVLQLPALGQYYNNFGKNKVRYAKFDWTVYHGTHFDVWYYPEEEHLLEKVLSLAESAYDGLSQELDYQIQEPTPLILYKTHSDFLQTNIISNFIPEGVGAFATPNYFRMVLPIDMPDTELYDLIRHELTHIFQYHILFSGSLGKALTQAPPQWFMEGMASFYAKDETADDRMYLVDAVVNDRLPPITEGQFGGFFAYRYGHAAFDFIEDRWGKDGLQDFLYEFRNTLGARVGKAVERAFRIDPEDFDAEFRRWLRQKYLPTLLETGEPSDFGRPFRTKTSNSQETSPVASPSGDLVAAFSTLANDLDVVLFDAEKRRFLRNLTKGRTSTKFQNLISQHLTIGRRMGRDLAFSPDGNMIASFASKREAGRSLVLINVVKGGIERIIDMEVEQQQSPAWSPDGKTIAFSGNTGGVFDIFLMDVDTLEIRNLTNDDIYDGAPTYHPTDNTLVFSSVVGELQQLFRIDLTTGQRTHIMKSESNDTDAVYSPDGERLYFTSDRVGANNIFGLDPDGTVHQYTNAVTGCFMPTVLAQPDGSEVLVYTGYWKGRFDLYQTEVDESIADVQIAEFSQDIPTESEAIALFEPDILVTLDEANNEKKRGFKLFLEDAGGAVGVDVDQTYIGQVFLQFADFLGDRRLLAVFSSVSSFQNFDVIYSDLSRRNQRSLYLYDDRTFYRGENFDFFTGQFERGPAAIKNTGFIAAWTHPFNFNRRVTLGAGYQIRDLNYQSFGQVDPSNVDPEDRDKIVFDNQGNAFVPVVVPRKDDFPLVQADLVGDTTVFSSWGPTSGHRYRISTSYAPDLASDKQSTLGTTVSNTLTASLSLDARQYVPITRRSLFVFRLFVGVSEGNFPTPFYFGSYDTLRGYEFREFSGDRTFFTNIEFRFPLIDLLATPIFNFQGIRARVFLDVGGAWYNDLQDFNFYDSDLDRLEDGRAAYGFGITIRFMGLDLNWDFAKRWDFDSSTSAETTFWIGSRF